MLSKFLRPTYVSTANQLVFRKISPKVVPIRYVKLIPPTQYDLPTPKVFKLGQVMSSNWEIIPLLASTLVAVLLAFLQIVFAVRNKVDVVFTTHSRKTISRTMDLRYPTIHKLLTFNQKYEPWPEMQDVLDKMNNAEKRAKTRAEVC